MRVGCRAEEERAHLRQQQAEVERKLEAAAKLEAEAKAEAKHAALRGAEQERSLAQQADHLRRQEADLVSCFWQTEEGTGRGRVVEGEMDHVAVTGGRHQLAALGIWQESHLQPQQEDLVR